MNKIDTWVYNGFMGGIMIAVVIIFSTLCLLQIIPVPQYVNFMSERIVDATKSLVLCTLIGGFFIFGKK